ncbi:MAG TPA: hypothetical protein VGF97_02015 [Rhizomicrobium sp.]
MSAAPDPSTANSDRRFMMLDVWMLLLGLGLFAAFLGYTALRDAM